MEAGEFKKIFLPFRHRIYRIAFALTGNKEDAEDMVQETYLRIWRIRNDLNGVDNFETFSVTIVKNLCLNLLRKRIKSSSANEDQAPALLSDTDISREIESRDAVAVIAGLMEKLPEKQLEVIRMRDIAGCTIEEIEECTGLSSVNIRTLLSRARRKLRQQFNSIMNYQRHE